MSGDARLPCPRCGIVRHARKNGADRICRDCRLVDPGWPAAVHVSEHFVDTHA